MLKVAEAKILQVCLDGLKNMLTIAAKLNNLEWMCMTIESCGGLDAIEDLQQHGNEDVYNMAQGLIDVFFNAEEEEEVENLAPETQANDAGQNFFQFGGGDADAGKPAGGFHL
jgi:importin subunit alpha-2